MVRVRRLLALALAGAAAILATALPGAAAAEGVAKAEVAPAGERVVLWGDSLAYESAGAFVRILRGIGVEAGHRTFPGTAPCDWLDDILARAAEGPLGSAVLEFSGNAFTPCMRRGDGGPLSDAGVLASYRRDLEAAAGALLAAGARVYLVAAPTFAGEVPGDRHDLVRGLIRRLAGERPGLHVIEAGSAVTDGGAFTSTLPCRPWERADEECRANRVTVRSPDGIHFCPRAAGDALGLIASCPVRSPGAERFGYAMAVPVAAATLFHHISL